MEQLSIFDYMSEEDKEIFAPKKSNDWKWKFSDYPKEKNGLKVFSCFACGGGSTMGYKLAGCDVIGCVEIDERMNRLYIANHKPKLNYLMDIREFNKIPNDQLDESLFDLDILDGSPPCTPFSVCGDREESWGKLKKFREGQAKQTLDDLSFVFIDTVKKLNPKVVIMENVEGLLLGAAFEYVRRIYTEFGAAGYKLHHWLLKGEYMGVPQTRHRVFFLAIREDLGIDPGELDMTFNYLPIKYKDIQQGEGERLNENTEIYKWLLKAEPQDKRISDTIVRHGQKEKMFGHRVCWPERVMQTIPAKGEIMRGIEKTRVSVEDIFSSQTFPQDYYLPEKNFNSAVYVCGMSVPPLMIKRIVERLISQGVFNYKR